MAYTQEIRIPQLPGDTDNHVRAYYKAWCDAVRGNNVPDRKVLSSDVLAPWIDDICIYEYLPHKRDFVIRIDAPNIIAASGEVYRGCSPRQIDLDFGTTLLATLLDVIDRGQPVFHKIGYERKIWEEWLRLLLPVTATDRQGKVISQVFVTHFFYRGK
ncbi:hypothetical protein [Thalassospira aquimaris]|uniref:PAS domain-containing protein n=1 Tax=Thalassospira aquimaris TaxID=3037796 RepID=A0ABT6GCI8_9PROT|nr:hypothetical protein [Thalassospira sp. FZY0004]MDG4719414.1 hypothetical protein [Thalassospira sp. FZY0004]